MMIAATFIQSSAGLEIERPKIWDNKLKAGRRGVMANVRGRRLEVFVGMVDTKIKVKVPLWYYNNFRDAEDFDEPVGQVVIATDPQECITWLKSYTPRGPDQDSIVDFYSHFYMPAWWKQRQDQFAKDYAAWQEDQQISLQIWYAREEERMRAEDEALTEQPQFPVETDDDENLEDLL